MNDDTVLPMFAGTARAFDAAQAIPLSSVAAPQPDPTGNGDIVLLFVLAEWAQGEHGLTDKIALHLIERAQLGKAKYGTYLRTCNGRDAETDYLQEQLDAIMYATQAYMENPSKRRAKMIDLAVTAAKLVTEEE